VGELAYSIEIGKNEGTAPSHPTQRKKKNHCSGRKGRQCQKKKEERGKKKGSTQKEARKEGFSLCKKLENLKTISRPTNWRGFEIRSPSTHIRNRIAKGPSRKGGRRGAGCPWRKKVHLSSEARVKSQKTRQACRDRAAKKPTPAGERRARCHEVRGRSANDLGVRRERAIHGVDQLANEKRGWEDKAWSRKVGEGRTRKLRNPVPQP